MSQFCFLEVYLEKAITTETNTGWVHEGKRRQVRRSRFAIECRSVSGDESHEGTGMCHQCRPEPHWTVGVPPSP